MGANDGLSPMLADRMDTASVLYKAGKVRKLLISGDNLTCRAPSSPVATWA